MDIDFDISTPHGRRHVAAQLMDLSIEELRLALLRAIDHAVHNESEFLEVKARLDGALGQVAGLRNRLRELDPDDPELDDD